MRLITYLAVGLLLLGCTKAGRDANPSASQFDFLSLHWEARGSTNDVRFCELIRTGERIAVEPEVVLGVRHFAAARVTHDTASSTYHVDVALTPEGRSRFKELSSTNIGRRLAIVLDDDVVALPTIWRTVDTETLDLMPTADARLAEGLAKRINTAILSGSHGS